MCLTILVVLATNASPLRSRDPLHESAQGVHVKEKLALSHAWLGVFPPLPDRFPCSHEHYHRTVNGYVLKINLGAYGLYIFFLPQAWMVVLRPERIDGPGKENQILNDREGTSREKAWETGLAKTEEELQEDNSNNRGRTSFELICEIVTMQNRNVMRWLLRLWSSAKRSRMFPAVHS